MSVAGADGPAERRAKLEAILENAVDAIITIDDRGLIESANPATERLFGYRLDELLGNNVRMLMPEPHRGQHDGYLQAYQRTGEAKIIGIGREVAGRRRDGSEFPLHLAVSEINVSGRRLYTAIVRDISDLKAIELQLAQLNEQLEERVRQRTEELREAQAKLVQNERFATLGKVAGGIAHEIRNPLNAVKMSAYFLLRARNPSEEKVREHLERVDRQVSMIDSVVTALSDVAKLPEADGRPCDPAELLQSATKSIGLPADVQLQWELPPQAPAVMADQNQVLIALMNLIRNARDAMADGGVMTLGVRVDDRHVGLFIRDTGVGIPEENRPKILEPLFTTKARGMGLGLSITSAIVEKNQGRLEVDSQLGQGSCFTIWLRRSDGKQ